MKKIVSIVIIVVLAGGVLGLKSYRHKKPSEASASTLVKLSAVNVASIPITAKATGNLAANKKTSLSAKVGGYITQIDFKEGQYVKTGAALIQLDDSKQKQQLLASKADAGLAKVTYDRYLKLSKQNITSPQDLDQYRSNYEKALAALKGDEVELDETVLRAPFNGYLGAKTVSIGDYVNPGQALATLTDTETLRIDYSLPSWYSPKLKMGQAVTITADFLPGKKFTAKASYIAPFVDPNTQTIEVHATLSNKDQILKPGQSVNISQQLGADNHAILIPEDALIANIDGSYVYGVQNNKIVKIPVTAGGHYKNQVIILKGLTAQDKIVTKGQFQVKNGEQVRVVT